MLYMLRQKFFCLGDDYIIKDHEGNDRFIADGSALSLRNRTTFRDMDGNELATLHRRLLSLSQTYEINRGGHTTTVYKHLFTLFSCKFTVDVPGPDDLTARGNLFDMEYAFQDASGKTVAEVSKRWFSLQDTYGVEIADGHDDVLILCAAVVIDLCCHADGKH